MEIKLRDYQDDLISGARNGFKMGKRAVLLVSPTGSGKGIILPWLARSLVQNNKRVLIMVHRRRLVKQLCKAMDGLGVCYDLVSGKKRLRYVCQIGMVKTVGNRKESLPQYDYILTDEAHRATAPEYVGVYSHFPEARRIFLTATPARTDGKGLKEVADHMVIGPSMKWLIEEGFLAPYRYFEPPSDIDYTKIKLNKDGDYDEKAESEAISKSHIIGDAVKHYRRLLDGKRAIVFCRGIEKCKETASEFEASGIPSAAIDGTMSESDQERILDDFAKGRILCLMSADLISEGVDIPECQGVIFLRRTKSVILFLQAVGRALRVKADRSYAVIIDCVGNSQEHGYPADPREWSLEGAPKKKGEVCIKTCERCQRSFHQHEARKIASEECEEGTACPIASGSQADRKISVTEVIDEDLVEVENPWAWTHGIDAGRAKGVEWEALMAKADSLEKLKQIARARGYHHRWATVQAIQKGLVKETRSFRKYKGK